MEALKDELCKTHSDIEVHTIELDVRNKQRIDEAVASLPMKDNIDILVNNAGLVLGVDHLKDVTEEAYDIMFDTNVKGLVFLTQALLPSMIARGSGHIINIGSVAGIYVTYPNDSKTCFIYKYLSRKTKLSWWKYILWYVIYLSLESVRSDNGIDHCNFPFFFFQATKHAVDAITKALLYECMETPIRVSQICPGLVNTEFSTVRFHGDKAKADDVYKGLQPLVGQDIAELVTFTASRPPHVNICDMLGMYIKKCVHHPNRPC